MARARIDGALVMNTKAVGDASVAQVMASLIKKGKKVLIPFGDNDRYDFVLDDDGKFLRVQGKTGKLKNGVVRFLTSSTTRKSKNAGWSKKSYHGQIDLFGVYCPQNDKCYLISIDELPNVNEAKLRVEPAKKMKPDIRWAKDYEI